VRKSPFSRVVSITEAVIKQIYGRTAGIENFNPVLVFAFFVFDSGIILIASFVDCKLGKDASIQEKARNEQNQPTKSPEKERI
jgi:hypothetical protein